MGFWQNNNVEPKRGFRFVLRIVGDTFGIKEYLVKSVKTPGFTIGDQTIQYLNHTFHYPGRVTWDECSFVIVDTVNDDSNGTAELLQLLQASGFEMPEPIGTEGKGLKSVSKAKAAGALGQVSIETLNAEGIVVETWVLNNAWIKTAAFGDYDYGSEEVLNVSVSLAYDNAYLTRPGKANVPFYPGGS
jgi:hypothetical protein